MWRTRAVQSLLLHEVAGLPRDRRDDEPAGLPPLSRSELRAGQRRARLVVAGDWLALAVLLLARDATVPWLDVGTGIETVFAAGIIAVAVHSGFRLGQLEKLGAVARALDELDERTESADRSG